MPSIYLAYIAPIKELNTDYITVTTRDSRHNLGIILVLHAMW